MKLTLDFKEKTVEVEDEVILDTLLIKLEEINIDFTEWSIKGKSSFFTVSPSGSLWGGGVTTSS